MPLIKIERYMLRQRVKIETRDSITDRARGLVGKRGNTAMRERFFSFKKKNSEKWFLLK